MDRSDALLLLGAVCLVGAMALFVQATVDIDELRDFSDRAEEWCDAEGGTLGNANAFGASGGLHCYDIGAHVHMQDVEAAGWTHDLDAIQQEYAERTGPLGMFSDDAYTVVPALTIAIAVPLLAFIFVQRWRREQPA